jgi:hypothetical protein
MRSSSTIPTGHGRRYMIQLCKHFGHRLEASFDDREGRIGFAGGEVRLRASPDNLMVVADAEEDEALARLERVVESHLRRFAFREPDLAVDWRRAG